jgi:hypothetical protein
VKKVLLLLLVVFSTSLNGQNAAVKADRYKIKIGEQIKLSITANPLKDQRLIWPEVGDTLGQWFDVVRKDTLDTLNTSGILTLKQQIWITSFDTGMHNLPVFPFDFISLSGDTQHVVSDMLSIQIMDVAVDTSQAIKDIRGIETVPRDYSFLLKIAAIALAVLVLLAILLWLILRKRKPQLKRVAPPPSVPPWIKAISAIDQLEQKSIWREGQTKEFHSEITDILRIYLEEYLKIPAMESTTEEIINLLIKSGVNDAAREAIIDVLQLADLVKFAKVSPQPIEHMQTVQRSREFIALTRPGENRAENEKGEVV